MRKYAMIILCAAMLTACSQNEADVKYTAPPEPTAAEEAEVEVKREPKEINAGDYDGLDNNGVGWGLVRKKGAPPEIPEEQQRVLEENGGFYLDKRGGKNLYLTFDEGYENGFTSDILDTLKEKQVPAAFFVTGPYLEGQGELIRRMLDEGHIVGNHTINHVNLPKQSIAVMKDEIDGLSERCMELYGADMVYMRPPEGEYSERTLAATRDMGYTTVMWSFAYKDWDVNYQQGADHAYEQVTQYLHDGAIILLHAVSSDNAGALGRIIDYARENGYTFRSLDYLLSE